MAEAAPALRTDQEAWRIVEENQDLVKWSVNRYIESRFHHWSNASFEDLLTAANLAAFRAARSWDPEKGTLGNHLPLRIKHALKREEDALQVGAKITQGPRYSEPLGRISAEVREEGNTHELGEVPEEALFRAEEPGYESFEDEVVERVDAERMAGAVRAALQQLPDRQREAMLLRYVDELTLEQVGEKLGISRQGAQQLVHRAQERLRASLGAAA